ncbi:hypothetical protein FHX10_003361 [Rhizobium sp. BK591]|uniref:hypothetical protein n=1 Tax=Rhizobium sp. BK591 TaxID=2586985 RepID=UPI00161D3855|nr:hypothetical protein [Rhizobium sp. BK591]MBB3743862.1 hypothetical protein [Rhizobium sp. BK591]
MADVSITPRISCDNCGLTVDKHQEGSYTSKSFKKPRDWGSLKIEGSRSADSYGGKENLDFIDLCPRCATAALDAAASVLKTTRGEE